MSKYPKIEHSPYVPHYRQMKITPILQDGNSGFIAATSIPESEDNTDNPRLRKPGIATSKHMPYAEVGDMLPKTESVPNIGNNIEHTWVGVDGDIVDDLGINEEVSNLDSEYAVVKDDEVEVVENIGEYVLIFNGEIISTGSLSLVQEDVRALIFGEHALSKNNNISVDDLIVLKRVPIKVGVFIE